MTTASAQERVRIYQLFMRLFSNTNETRKPNGTITENGSGKFNEINVAALASLKEMGFTHLWLTGVLRQATATAYPAIGMPADDPDLLKGLAGSPYAIKDYFDVCPDYAENPANRIEEFKALLARVHDAGLKALIDLVPNHVARSYHSSIKPECNFGVSDDKTKFFDPQNNFYYLQPDSSGPPLRLPTVIDGKPVSPTCRIPGMKCDGLFEGEKEFGRVTGNNVASWRPDIRDWYETVKLNYGWEFTTGQRAYPWRDAPTLPVPDTWNKMDRIIEYWQAVGVDGFRCDMAHMVPTEFWAWLIRKARARQPETCFIGEAYDNDPAKIPGISGNNVLLDLIEAGFDSVYDDPVYKAIKKIYDGPGWANDIDLARGKNEVIFHHSLRYAENHDEARLAAASQWGGASMEVGRAVCGVLYGLSRGHVLLFNGQEVGEPAAGVAGFGGGNAHTSIFDYWSMPELAKWVNRHRYDGEQLSEAQKNLRAFYRNLLKLAGEPAFRNGGFFPLNPANNSNLLFGSSDNASAGGQWLYAFLRYDPLSAQRFLVIVNLHREKEFRNIPVLFPAGAIAFLDISEDPAPFGQNILRFADRIGNCLTLTENHAVFTRKRCLIIPAIPSLTPCYLEITVE